MGDGIQVDSSELDRLAADLEEVTKNIGPFLVSALEFTSVRIKRGAAQKVRRRRRFRGAARAIDFDVKHFRGFGATVIESEIGYDKEKGGSLGSLVEFGAPGSPNALTPGNELQSTLREEEPDFLKGIEKAVDDAHRRSNL